MFLAVVPCHYTISASMDEAIRRNILEYLRYHDFSNTVESFQAELRKKAAAEKAGKGAQPRKGQSSVKVRPSLAALR